MADIPEYQRTTPIKPQQAVQGFGEATKGFGSFASNIAKMGADIAQESANKYAQMQGIEAAQKAAKTRKPNLGAMLPLTEADKHFTTAYNQEIGQQLGYEGQQMLQSFLRTAQKTPTSSALSDYEQFGKQGIEDIVKKAPKPMQSSLRRGLEDMYINGFHKLADRVETADRQYMESLNNAAFNQQLDDISNLTLSNDLTGGYAALKTAHENIEFRAKQYADTGGQEGWAPHIALEAKRQADDRWRAAVGQNEWRLKDAQGKGNAYLKYYRENKPDSMTEAEHDRVMRAMISYAQEFGAARSAQQSMDYIKYATKVATGQMTEADLLGAQEKLSERQMAELESRIAIKAYKDQKQVESYNYYHPRFMDEVAMSPVSGTKAMDGIFEQHVKFMTAIKEHETGQAQEVTLADRAEYAKDIAAMVPSLNKDLGAMMKSTNPQKAYEAAKIFSAMDISNPKSVEGIGGEAVQFAKTLLRGVENGASVQEAHTVATEQAQKLTPAQREEREKEFDTIFKSEVDNKGGKAGIKALTQIENRKQFVLQAMGIDNPGFFGRVFLGRDTIAMPDGLTTAFVQQMKDKYVSGRTFEQAQEMASRELGRVWKVTTINGVPQVMWMPPEMFLNSPFATEYAKFDLMTQIANQFNKAGKTLTGFSFDISEGENIQTLAFGQQMAIPSAFGTLQAQTAANRPQDFRDQAIKMSMTDSNGKTVKGKVLVVSDNYTNKVNPGEIATYQLQFLPDGKQIPKMLTLPDGRQFRYILSAESLDKAREAYTRKMQALHEDRNKAKRTGSKVFELRETATGESQYDLP